VRELPDVLAVVAMLLVAILGALLLLHLAPLAPLVLALSLPGLVAGAARPTHTAVR
jgi:hypothetical protein